jgi:hypothetical protein
VDKWTAHRLRSDESKFKDLVLALISSRLPSARYHVRHHYDIFYGTMNYAKGTALKAEKSGTPNFRMHLAQLAGHPAEADTKKYIPNPLHFVWYTLNSLVRLAKKGVWIMDLSPEPIYMGSYETGGCNARTRSERGEYVVKIEKNRYLELWRSLELAMSYDMIHEQVLLSEGVENVIVVGKSTSATVGEARYKRLITTSNDTCKIY